MRTAESAARTLRVVALGGGTGLPVVLRGLKRLLYASAFDDAERLVGIVTVTDDGGSSGRLRQELGMLPPGDVRNCLVALSHNEPLMARVFQARYKAGGTLEGHSAGNLILAALAQEEGGSFLGAIRLASEVLSIQGRVLPATLASGRLVATLTDGRRVAGESSITAAGGRIESLELEPPALRATPGVSEAIMRADLVVLGPGSLFTSIVPNLLVDEIAEALARTAACRVLVLNAMTELGETGSFSASDHVRAVSHHLGPGALDALLLATDELPDAVLARYRAEGAARVDPYEEGLEELVPHVLRRPLLAARPKVRHDAVLTANALIEACCSLRAEKAGARVGGGSAR